MKTKWTKAAAVDAMTRYFADDLFATWHDSIVRSIVRRWPRRSTGRGRAFKRAYELMGDEARKTLAITDPGFLRG
jgi:hypothetical protein